ncbi:MAG: hypothetical protein NVS2B8_19430 [Vulcanimicrobiaceae bacterium]
MIAFESTTSSELVTAVLDGAPFGIALIDQSDRTVFANAAMRRFEADGFLTLEAGRLRFATGECHRAFARAVERARESATIATLVVRSVSASDALVVTVTDVAASGTIVRAVHLDEVGYVEPAAFEATLSVTPAEARIAALLASGCDGYEIGTQLGLARETVRTHIKRLLQKTGTHRQSELVLTLARASMIYGGARYVTQ